jgi:hypothetical protein
MKKLVLTAAIILGFVMGSNAQGLFQNQKTNGGLFNRGAVSDTKGEDAGIWLPGHNIIGNADAEEEPSAPLGGGAMLLIGFGAAYAMSKRNKKD